MTAKPAVTHAVGGGSRAKGGRAAFTLIELLVVIAVILILMSIMLPVVNQVRRSAKRATCRNNLSQIGRALNSYAITFENFLPPCEYYAFDIWRGGVGWVGLGHLIGNGLNKGDCKIFHCPSLNTRLWKPSMTGYWDALFGHGMYNYDYLKSGIWHGSHRVGEDLRTIIGYQYRMSGFDESPTTGGHGRCMSIEHDSQRSVVADQLDWRFGPDFCHKVGLNVLFVDGHVVWYHDNARYIETAGYPWSADSGTAEYEVFWRLFDKSSAGSVEVGTLVE